MTSKLPRKEVQEFVVEGNLATNLETLIYGDKKSKGKKISQRDEFDSTKIQYSHKFNNIEDYVQTVKEKFMAGTDFIEEEEEEDDDAMSLDDKSEEGEPQAPAIFNGLQIGAYVKINLKGISEDIFLTFKAEKPLMICAIRHRESNLGLISTRFTKHMWYKKILKSNDPLIVSIGWHRFQTLPMYATEDPGTDRMRVVKYTPKYSYCKCIFYGPFVPVNTPFLAV